MGRSNVYLITLCCTTIYPCSYRRLAPSRLLFLDRSDGALSIFSVRDSKTGFILIRGRVYQEVIHTSSRFCYVQTKLSTVMLFTLGCDSSVSCSDRDFVSRSSFKAALPPCYYVLKSILQPCME